MPIKPAAPSFRTEHHLPFEVVCEAVRLWVEKHHVALGLDPYDLALVSLRFTGVDADTMTAIASVPRSVKP
jgi:hypothetical protein